MRRLLPLLLTIGSFRTAELGLPAHIAYVKVLAGSPPAAATGKGAHGFETVTVVAGRIHGMWVKFSWSEQGGRKRRKQVDRRASKGRKLRYHVHEKLVNFVAPRPPAAEPAFATQLFANLFGRQAG